MLIKSKLKEFREKIKTIKSGVEKEVEKRLDKVSQGDHSLGVWLMGADPGVARRSAPGAREQGRADARGKQGGKIAFSGLNPDAVTARAPELPQGVWS